MSYYNEDEEYAGSMFGGNRKCREGYNGYTMRRCLPEKCSDKYGGVTRSTTGKCPSSNPKSWTESQKNESPSGYNKAMNAYKSRHKNWFNKLDDEKKKIVRGKRTAAKKKWYHGLSDERKQTVKQKRNASSKARYKKKPPRKTVSAKDLDAFFDAFQKNSWQ